MSCAGSAPVRYRCGRQRADPVTCPGAVRPRRRTLYCAPAELVSNGRRAIIRWMTSSSVPGCPDRAWPALAILLVANMVLIAYFLSDSTGRKCSGDSARA